MSRTPGEISDMYRSAETVAESDGHEVLKDGDDDYWIGRKTESSGLDEEYTLVSSKQVDAFTTMLRYAGLLEDAESSEEAESADVTPVSEVRDLERGQTVKAVDCHGGEKAGTLASVEVVLSPTDNPYKVNFDNGSEWIASRIEPAETADESRAPEDVAGTWIKATDHHGTSVYTPEDEIGFAEATVQSCPFAVEPSENQMHRNGNDRRDAVWNTRELETVDASDLPFSEVSTDE